MKRALIILGLFLYSCQPGKEAQGVNSFSSDLSELAEYFQIPGIGAIVLQNDETIYEEYFGYASIEEELEMNAGFSVPMASLTKIFTAVVVLQLVEEGKLMLTDPVVKYTNSPLDSSIQVGHLLSHTSQGEPGQKFYYNNSRFMVLKDVIESVDTRSFRENVEQRIINRLGLEDTYFLVDSMTLVSENRTIARPYFLGGEIENGVMILETRPGFIDFGYSPAAGITASIRDMAKFGSSLPELLDISSLQKMTTPFYPGSPYGLGIFSQEIEGTLILWGYGQYDCYSSLLLIVPEKDLTLVLAANNNLMSDPARLINGNVAYSMFAQSFLRHYVKSDQHTLFDDTEDLDVPEEPEFQTLKAQRLVGQAVAASFMSRFDHSNSDKSKEYLRHLFEYYPEYQEYGDLTIMHNIITLKFLDEMRGFGDFQEFDQQFLTIGHELLKDDPSNPYANYYMANYFEYEGTTDSTRYYYEKIINANNFTTWWYTQEAMKKLDR